MDWGFIGTLFGLLLVAGILVLVLVGGRSVHFPAPAPAPAADAEAPVAKEIDMPFEEVRAQRTETWCFVHEDYLGRWCVKTPSPANCDPTHRFASQEACEMVTASALPLGPVEKRGTQRRPFAAMSNGLW